MLKIHFDQLKDKYWVRENEFRTNCIFCGDRKKHLYGNISIKVFHCFKCNSSGILLLNNDVISIPNNNDKKRNFDFNTFHLNFNALKYLNIRINDMDIILKLKPFTLDDFEEYKDYVFFNYSDEGIVGRLYIEDENKKKPKYLFLKKLNAPYGFSKINKKYSKLFIVEGIFDMIPFIKRNVNVVALFGKHLSSQFYSLLESTKLDMFLVLDGDAHSQIDKLCLFYKNLKPVYLPKNEDPFSLRNEIEKFCII